MQKKMKDVILEEKIRPVWFNDPKFAIVKGLDRSDDGHILAIVEVEGLGIIPVEFHEDDEVEIDPYFIIEGISGDQLSIPAKETGSIIGGGGDGFEDEGK